LEEIEMGKNRSFLNLPAFLSFLLLSVALSTVTNGCSTTTYTSEGIARLSVKERIAYRFIFNENRVYKYWYNRFLVSGMDLDRIRRVIPRIKNFYVWCDEWAKEGEMLQKLAEDALSKGNTYSARCLFQEAAACFHIGQHFYFLDIERKNKAQERVRENYKRAIALYDEDKRPIRLEIPFRGTVIPGYLRLTKQPNKPLIILISGADNLKEIENHYCGDLRLDAGFNVFAFDGPGQGEMWKNMKLITDYEKAVSTIIDYLEKNNKYNIDLKRIGVEGWSLGGYLAPRAAAFDKRICCAVGNGGPAHFRDFLDEKKVIPIVLKQVPYMAGTKTYEEALKQFDIDIKKAPPMDRPLLIFHSGKDKYFPDGKEHADYFMEWAVGEKELKYYPDGEHCCINYKDEVNPYINDWFRKYLMK
jgi:alpha-beta hydrolase superfamily lysophospholipase